MWKCGKNCGKREANGCGERKSGVVEKSAEKVENLRDKLLRHWFSTSNFPKNFPLWKSVDGDVAKCRTEFHPSGARRQVFQRFSSVFRRAFGRFSHGGRQKSPRFRRTGSQNAAHRRFSTVPTALTTTTTTIIYLFIPFSLSPTARGETDRDACYRECRTTSKTNNTFRRSSGNKRVESSQNRLPKDRPPRASCGCGRSKPFMIIRNEV